MPDLVLRLALLFICSGWWLNAAAQLPGITFSHYGSDDGLPNDNISALAFDREGFLWIGTTDGLARFDGRRFDSFRHVENDPLTIPYNVIYGIQTDPMGRLWVSTEQGLCWYDAQNGVFHPVFIHRLDAEKEPYIGWLSSLLVGSDGYGWIGAGNFLIRLDLSTFEMVYYPYPDNLGGISTPFEDSKHRMWLNMAGRTYRFFRETGTFKYYQGHTDGHPSTGGINEDAQGNVWAGSWGNGFYRYNETLDRFEDYPDKNAITTAFLFDKLPGYGPSIWVGGGIYGVYILTLSDTIAHEFPTQSLEPYSHNGTRVMAMLRDSATGIVWLGTEGGLEKYDPRDLKCSRNYLPEEESKGQFVAFSRIVQDPSDSDHYWIAVWGAGLFEWRRKENRYKHHSVATGLHDNEPFDMLVSKRRTLWLAQVNGVQEVDIRTGRSLRVLGPRFLKTPRIFHKVLSIEEGSDGSIWIGSNF
ncbi:MAG TPA: two-component regulator propeller domain-containing protein, partial [Saprospiraceae bacterium]|nr:two-component regulator propeller domain-containing protein [Saprospiraceae bacterium]